MKISAKTTPDTIIQLSLVIFLLLMISVYYMMSPEKDFSVKEVFKPRIQWAPSPSEIWHGDTSKKQVIFTFDGGDGIQSGEEILSALAKHGVRGTFFLTGKFIQAHPEFVRETIEAGHEVFNHTYDHPHLTAITDEEIVNELIDMNDILSSTTATLATTSVSGISSRPYFRAPYGDRDARVLGDAYRAGYQSVYWTVDAHDWEESSGTTDKEVTNRIMNNLRPGNIYLMHIGDDITGRVLDRVFMDIEDKGYKIVSLTEGL